MNAPQICALLSAAFAGSMAAYVPTARERGWPIGSIFERGVIPTAVYCMVAVTLLGTVIGWAWTSKASWLWLLWVIIASFVGAPLFTSLFKSWSAAISLLFSPVLAILAVVLPFSAA